MPQPKKHPSVRARANKASTAAKLSNDHTAIVPKLPPRPSEITPDGRKVRLGWHSETKSWWADVWASPMAAEFHSSDRHALFIIAVLVDKFWRNPSEKLAAEIRIQRVSFGLTPYDRRRLEWTIESAEESKDRGKARRSRGAAAQPSADDDPRLTLVN